MTREAQDDLRVSEEAALWLHRLANEDSPECRAGFDRWLRKGATNLEEFLFAQTVWKQLDHLGEHHRASLATAADTSVVGFPGQREAAKAEAAESRRETPHISRRWLFAAAAGVAAIGVAGLWVRQASMPRHDGNIYATEVGSQEAVKLADGSIVHLNTQSRVEVDYSDRQRIVHLKAGEALFTVAHDAARPFVVTVDGVHVRALGTQFNIYRTPGAARIAVTEGKVQVSDDGSGELLNLTAGETAEVRGTRIVKSAQSDIPRAVAWRARRLVFPGDRVADIAAEFNRYNTTQIRVEGGTLQNHLMSGVFDADNPTPWLDFLARDPDVTIDRGKHLIVIRGR